MATCPWCKAPVGDLLAPCPRCGRTADEQGGVTDGPAVPDLDLPVRAPKAAPVKSSGRASAAKVAVAAGAPSGAARAAEAAKASGPGKAAPAAKAVPAGRESRSEIERTNNAYNDPGARTIEQDPDEESVKIELASAALVPKPAPAPPPPKKEEEKLAPEEVSQREARALADYGEPPSGWLKAPLYAFRVLRRRKELTKLAATKKREAERADAAAEDAMLVFAELVRPSAERYGGAYDLAFEAVRATERVLGERDAVLASETDAHNQRKAQIDARLAGEEAELTQIQMEERRIVGELAEAEALLRRAEARAKHAEIEIRNAVAEAEGHGAGPASAAKGPGP